MVNLLGILIWLFPVLLILALLTKNKSLWKWCGIVLVCGFLLIAVGVSKEDTKVEIPNDGTGNIYIKSNKPGGGDMSIPPTFSGK
jgi:hypothetical protein